MNINYIDQKEEDACHDAMLHEIRTLVDTDEGSVEVCFHCINNKD